MYCKVQVLWLDLVTTARGAFHSIFPTQFEVVCRYWSKVPHAIQISAGFPTPSHLFISRYGVSR